MATPNQNIHKMYIRHGPSESASFLKRQMCTNHFIERTNKVFLIDDVKYIIFLKIGYMLEATM